MKQAPELNEHEDYLRKYLLLIMQCLKFCRNYSLNSMSISPDDKKVIEYYLKDVARRAMLQSASQDECEALFTARIGRLITSDREEWARTLELVREHNKLLTKKEIVEMDTLHREFTKKTVATA